MSTADVEKFKEREEKMKKEGYADIMRQPSTRMLVSLIPPGPNPEAVEVLLQTVFNAGFSSGMGAIVMTLAEKAFTPPRSGPPQV